MPLTLLEEKNATIKWKGFDKEVTPMSALGLIYKISKVDTNCRLDRIYLFTVYV